MKKKKRRRQIGRRKSKSKKQGRSNEEEEKKSIFIKVLGEKLKKERNVKGEQKLPITNSEVKKIDMYTCLN